MKKYLFIALGFFVAFSLLVSKTSISFAATIFQENLSGTSGQNWNPSYFTLHDGSNAVYTAGGVQGTGSGGTYVAPATMVDGIVKWTMNLNGNPGMLVACRDNNDFGSEDRAIFADGNVDIQEFLNGNGNELGSANVGSSGIHDFELDCSGQTITLKEDGSTILSGSGGWDSNQSMTQLRLVFFDTTTVLEAYEYCDTSGCSGGPTTRPTPTPTPTPVNHVPVAVAGTSLDANNNVQLDGSLSSDPDNDLLNYSWQISGESSPRTGQKVLINDLTQGTYTVALTVSDGSLSAVDTTKVGVVTKRASATVAMTISSLKVNKSTGAISISGTWDTTNPLFATVLSSPLSRILFELQTGGTSTNPIYGVVGEKVLQLTTTGSNLHN